MDLNRTHAQAEEAERDAQAQLLQLQKHLLAAEVQQVRAES